MGRVEERESYFGYWQASGPVEERLEQIVRGLTYQDGWTFTLSRGHGGIPWLTIEWELPDVDDPRQRTLIAGGIAFREAYGADALRVFLYDVWETVGRFEAHERLEQLRIDGATIWDPHPPGSRAAPLVCAPDLSAPIPALNTERVNA